MLVVPATTGDGKSSMQSAASQARGCDLEIIDIHITSDFNSWLCAQQPRYESQLQACAAHKVIFLSVRYYGLSRLFTKIKFQGLNLLDKSRPMRLMEVVAWTVDDLEPFYIQPWSHLFMRVVV